jgi:DNA-binding CsgD family transcriptional regulator
MAERVVNFARERQCLPPPLTQRGVALFTRAKLSNGDPRDDRMEQLLGRLCAVLEELAALQRRRAEDVASGAALSLERAGLSRAEHELLENVLSGLSNKEIAALRQTSVKTVKGQLTGVYRKLAVPGRTKLLAQLR